MLFLLGLFFLLELRSCPELRSFPDLRLLLELVEQMRNYACPCCVYVVALLDHAQE